jgi:hypothetical protein
MFEKKVRKRLLRLRRQKILHKKTLKDFMYVQAGGGTLNELLLWEKYQTGAKLCFR